MFAWITLNRQEHFGKSPNSCDFTPIDPTCTCSTCTHLIAAPIYHHLFKAKELSALTFASIHNLHFMVEEMRCYRDLIAADSM